MKKKNENLHYLEQWFLSGMLNKNDVNHVYNEKQKFHLTKCNMKRNQAQQKWTKKFKRQIQNFKSINFLINKMKNFSFKDKFIKKLRYQVEC